MRSNWSRSVQSPWFISEQKVELSLNQSERGDLTPEHSVCGRGREDANSVADDLRLSLTVSHCGHVFLVIVFVCLWHRPRRRS